MATPRASPTSQKSKNVFQFFSTIASLLKELSVIHLQVLQPADSCLYSCLTTLLGNTTQLASSKVMYNAKVEVFHLNLCTQHHQREAIQS